MASVCKLPIALQILAMVDEHKLNLDAPLKVSPHDVTTNVSEVGAHWPQRKIYPLADLLALMVAKSDNTAVETLYRLAGGGPAITARLRAWTIDGIRIDRSKRQCNRDSSGPTPEARYAALRRLMDDPRDTASPDATVKLLSRTFRGASTARIVEIMESTTTSPARIRGLLPPGTPVAHKTGTAGRLNAATNDVGVVTLPGRAGRLALAFYVKGSTLELPERERIIARLALSPFEQR